MEAEPESLTAWLEAWTEFGNAIEVAAGDYALLLEVYIAVRARVAAAPVYAHLADVLGEQERWPEDDMGVVLPSRELWNAQVFRRKYPAPAPTGFIGD